MVLLRGVLYGLITISFVSCGSAKNEAGGEVPQNQSSGAVGPFEVSVPEDGQELSHSFKIDIRQAEGKVEYFLTQKSDLQVEVVEAKSIVVGCDPAQVKVDHFWFQNAQDTFGYPAPKYSRFYTKKDTRGLFLVVFKGLTGCTSVEYQLRLKKV